MPPAGRNLRHAAVRLQQENAAASPRRSCRRRSPQAKPLICYSIKTNANLHSARLMAEHGAGFDVTSGGELYRALKAGGVGPEDRLRRRRQDRCRAPLRPRQPACCCSTSKARASCSALADVAKRIGQTAPGGPARQPRSAAQDARQNRYQRQGRQVRPRHRHGAGVRPESGRAIRTCKIVGLHMHLGSPILSVQPYQQGMEKGLVLIEKLRKQGHTSSTLTWAAASASTTASRRRCRRRPSPR